MSRQTGIHGFYVEQPPSLLHAMPDKTLLPFNHQRRAFDCLQDRGFQPLLNKNIHLVASRVPCSSFSSALAFCWGNIVQMLSMASPWIASTPHIAYFLCFRINFSIDHLPKRKGSLTAGMNKLALSQVRKPGKGRFGNRERYRFHIHTTHTQRMRKESQDEALFADRDSMPAANIHTIWHDRYVFHPLLTKEAFVRILKRLCETVYHYENGVIW